MHTGVSVLLPKLLTRRKMLTKLLLGVIFLSFLAGYQPAFSFPPIKVAKAYAADSVQTNSITPAQAPIQFILPHQGYISTYYSGYHPGVDIATGLGMPIHSIAAGTVVSQGFNFWGLGLTIEIDHGLGYKSLYAHLGKIYTHTGQQISTSDLIGEVGMTGNTSGPHTHLEVTREGRTINPISVLPKLPDISTAWASSQVAAKP